VTAWRCPSCKASTVYPGRIVAPGEFGTGAWFVPHATKTSVGVQVRFFACAACGHVWSSIAPGELRASIDTHGSALARQYLRATNGPPNHDLPDVPEARRAGDAVAVIDFLILFGRDVEARRKFHEMSGSTWDDTHAHIAGWSDMTRTRKLALFGWRSKDEVLNGLAQDRDHPMRDRDLDG
jgi:hypothetical protein